MRLLKGLRLRVEDVDFERNVIIAYAMAKAVKNS